jgi:hypothetical protein
MSDKSKGALVVGHGRFDAYNERQGATPPTTNVDFEALTIAGELTSESVPLTRDLIKEIAMDIGKEVVAYIEYMYPQAIEATSSTFKLSIRNCIHNQIMAALEVNEEGAVKARLADRKKWRREFKAMWKKNRDAKIL